MSSRAGYTTYDAVIGRDGGLWTDADSKQLVIERDEGCCIVCHVYGGSVHEILPKSRTSRRRRGRTPWLYEPRNRAVVCEVHHKHGAKRELLRILRDKYHYVYSDEPFRQYVYETDDSIGMYGGECGDCGAILEIVRPGKYQCPDCG